MVCARPSFSLHLLPACFRAWLTLLLLGIGSAAWAAHPIPAFSEVKAAARPSVGVLLARDGTPLAERRLDMSVRRLEWVGLNALSPSLKEALLAAEDKRFFEHSGVDWRAFAGSLWHNLWYERKRGASTLSMQLAGLLDPELALGKGGQARRSLGQKWDQALAAQALENRWTKEQILEAYLNLAPFRSDIQGVHAAARVLFNKTPTELGRAEALILAVLLRGPNARPEVVGRRACVLAERIGAPATCGPVQRLAQSSLERQGSAPRWDLAPHAARLLLTHPGERLVTTLDAEVQRQLLAILRKQAGTGEPAAAVVVDNASGDILGYVGGLDGAQADLAQVSRNIGSLYQPFVFGLAIERRLLTAASLLEEPLSNHAPTTPDERMWVSVRRALGESMPDPAANLMRLLGEGVVERLRLAEVDVGRGGLPDLTLVQLAGFYRSLASAGQWLPPRLQAAPGERQARRLLRPEAAFIVSDILVEPDEDGSSPPFAYRQYSPDGRDSFVVGYSERFTLVVWLSGARSTVLAAAQAWHELMRALHRTQPPQRLTPPPGVVSALVVFEPPIENARREWFLRGTETERVSPPRSLARITYPTNGALVDAMAIADDPAFRVVLEAVHVPPGSWWRLNGERLGNGGASAGSNGNGAAVRNPWRPVLGRHLLELMAPDGQVLDSVTFAVRAPLE